MSEDKDNNNPPDAVPPTPPSEPEPSQPEPSSPAPAATQRREDEYRQPAGGGFPVVATLALLLVLALGGAAAWLLMEAQRRESALLDRMAMLEALTEREVMEAGEQQAQLRELNDVLESELQGELREGLAELEPRLAEQAGRLRELSSQLERIDGRVSEHGEELARYSAADRESWQLAEVEYLLRLANQRLIMTGDTESAQALLRSADAILRQLDDTRLHDARRAVAADLAALRAVPRLDTEGLYLRLSALAEEAEQLAIFELPEAERRLAEAPADDWRGRLKQGYQAALQKLSDYIIIRRREVPMQALMDPQWEGLVRQNLRMLLEQSQVALLSGNARLYRESLQRARHWVAQFFESDGRAARAMDAELEQLAGEAVTVELPDISRSLRALDQALARRERDAATGEGA